MMTYHELFFIKAEPEFRTSSATWLATLQMAIEENFANVPSKGVFTDRVWWAGGSE